MPSRETTAALLGFGQRVVIKTVRPKISNGEIAELLAREAEEASGIRRRADHAKGLEIAGGIDETMVAA